MKDLALRILKGLNCFNPELDKNFKKELIEESQIENIQLAPKRDQFLFSKQPEITNPNTHWSNYSDPELSPDETMYRLLRIAGQTEEYIKNAYSNINYSDKEYNITETYGKLTNGNPFHNSYNNIMNILSEYSKPLPNIPIELVESIYDTINEDVLN